MNGRYLLEAVAKDAVQDEVSPEERPLALDVFKELQFGRLVVEPVWILEEQISHITARVQHQHRSSFAFRLRLYLLRCSVSIAEEPAAAVSALDGQGAEASEGYFRKRKWDQPRIKAIFRALLCT